MTQYIGSTDVVRLIRPCLRLCQASAFMVDIDDTTNVPQNMNERSLHQVRTHRIAAACLILTMQVETGKSFSSPGQLPAFKMHSVTIQQSGWQARHVVSTSRENITLSPCYLQCHSSQIQCTRPVYPVSMLSTWWPELHRALSMSLSPKPPAKTR